MSHAIFSTEIFFHSSVCSPGWVIFFLSFTYEYELKVSKTLYTTECQNCFNYIKKKKKTHTHKKKNKKKKKKKKTELISHIVLSGRTKEDHFPRNLLYLLFILAIYCSFLNFLFNND